ncbi:T9SS type A sorting domain-containing protein [Flavicella sp.]|uniref:T9SS type A sorting domain-containing protein n=1 Tax=Flavicella sp. TaxID=2957742 RepID=UPI00260BD6C4|nr:T9SS type A sorting domain-containing protein [Flavicella sp.]MDG1804120.1 T9SS type A sorting domain-containing protein [Flavicella sp.]
MIKKLLFTIAFFAIMISNAQSVSITAINGETPGDFQTSNPTLTSGTVLNVEITYTNLVAGADNIVVRFLTSGWSEVSGTVVTGTVANDANPLTTTLALTVPAINPGLSAVKVQARGSNVGGFVNSVFSPFDIAQDNSIEVNCNVSITTIEGVSVADYILANGKNLIPGDVLTFGVDYTAVKPDPGNSDIVDVRVRFLTNAYAVIPEATTISVPVTTLSTSQSTTADITVPHLDSALSGVRLQVLGYGYNGSTDAQNFGYASDTFDIDASVASIQKQKDALDLVYYSSGSDVIKVNSAISGEYSIYNMTGTKVQSGMISSQISVETLTSGVYIFVTQNGSIKFAK